MSHDYDNINLTMVREVTAEEKELFNQLAPHVLQSWEWGEFRKSTGIRVIRLGAFDKEQMKAGYQLTVHPIPKLPFTLIYFPKGPFPDKVILNGLKRLGQKERAILIKMEPNVGRPVDLAEISAHQNIKDFLVKNNCRVGQSLFTKYTFLINLNKTESQLLAGMKPKTRYNIGVSQRHQVRVVEDNSPEAFEIYLKLMLETTKRQGFYAHNPTYHHKMWATLYPAGISHLLLARYQKKILAAWILFVFNKTLYYPYGASTRDYQEVMPSYAMMWAAIQFGRRRKCKTFDLWGALSPNPNPKDPWYGFHRFKEGFGGQLTEFIGTYDLIIQPQIYPLYNLVNSLRWQFLHLKSRFL